jgi:septal ring factor EnvC (AmiA/AmiB activator)
VFSSVRNGISYHGQCPNQKRKELEKAVENGNRIRQLDLTLAEHRKHLSQVETRLISAQNYEKDNLKFQKTELESAVQSTQKEISSLEIF